MSSVTEALCFRTAFERLRHETQDMLVAFLEQRLAAELEEEFSSPGWQDLPIDEQGAAQLMGRAIRILEELANNLAKSAGDQIYEDASAVAQILQTILAEEYDLKPRAVRILPKAELVATEDFT